MKPEIFGVYRIIDANMNRLLEGCRVIEDYCRFIEENHSKAETLKTIRHSITERLKSLPLTYYRDRNDVGRDISTRQELSRSSVNETLCANFMRIKEALRVLEEFAKIRDTELGMFFKTLRYQMYDLEQEILAQYRKVRLLQFQLCFITSNPSGVEAAIQGGVDCIQFRDKHSTDREKIAKLEEIRTVTKRYNIPLIVNDRLDLCLLFEAEGLHLGQEDIPVSYARKILGQDKIVGVSTHSEHEVITAIQEKPDYISVGAIYPTRSKGRPVNVVGLELLDFAKQHTTIPIVAIGGINANNINSIISRGITKVAIMSAITANGMYKKNAAVLKKLLMQEV